MKSVILGSDGLVGSALAKQLPNAVLKPHDACDITVYDDLFNMFKNERPKVVYLPASITNVDKCENIETNVTNIRGAINVLRLCESFEAKLVYFSSGYVFDGESKWPYSPDQETNPIQNYGKQKATVENLILSSDADYLIVRTIGVFGRHKRNKNFPRQVINSVMSGKRVYAPRDQYMNPIWVDDLAQTTVKLVTDNFTGIFHVAGNECLTKYDFARRVASHFGYEDLVISVTSEEMEQKAKRPRMGCLDCSILEEVGLTVPVFERGLKLFLETYD